MPDRTTGIGGTDVAMLMSGLEGVHECRVELTVTTAGQGHNGLLNTTALAWVPTVEAQQTREVARVTQTWPNRDQPTYDSFLFNLLYELDRAIGRAYFQTEIPK